MLPINYKLFTAIWILVEWYKILVPRNKAALSLDFYFAIVYISISSLWLANLLFYFSRLWLDNLLLLQMGKTVNIC